MIRPTARLSNGERILDDAYVIERFLGAGTSAEVYAATNLALSAPRAVKIVWRTSVHSEAQWKARLERFEHEYQLLADIHRQYPRASIIQVHEVRTTADGVFAVLELCDQSVAALIRDRVIEVPEAVRILREAAHGLSALHLAGYIHRDVKPANLLLQSSGSVFVADLGEVLEPSMSFDGVRGTREYMAPEQARRELPSAASDVYSLGCVGFELLTRRRWWDCRGDCRSVRELRGDVPEWLDRVVMRMLSESVAESERATAGRYPAMAAVLAALDPHGPTHTEPDGQLAEPPTQAPDRSMTPSAGGGVDRRDALLTIMSDRRRVIAERAAAGRELAALGDPRPGVGLTEHGLPDIDWVEVPGVRGGRAPGHLLVARFPITWCQYEAFLRARDGYREERWWQDGATTEHRQQGPGRQSTPNATHPADHVSWYDAMAFCHWLSARLGRAVRLPTLAEWQAVAGGRNGNPLPWGSSYEIGRANVDETYPGLAVGPARLGGTSPVGMHDQGHPQGLRDLTGNVWEWTVSAYDAPTAAVARAICGGSWLCPHEDAQLNAHRAASMEGRTADIGFRVFSDEA